MQPQNCRSQEHGNCGAGCACWWAPFVRALPWQRPTEAAVNRTTCGGGVPRPPINRPPGPATIDSRSQTEGESCVVLPSSMQERASIFFPWFTTMDQVFGTRRITRRPRDLTRLNVKCWHLWIQMTMMGSIAMKSVFQNDLPQQWKQWRSSPWSKYVSLDLQSPCSCKGDQG